MREVCTLSAPKAHDATELLFGAPKAQVMRPKCAECTQTKCAGMFKKIKLANFVVAKRLFVKYTEPQSRSDCYDAAKPLVFYNYKIVYNENEISIYAVLVCS